MALKIRLRQQGRTNRRSFRLVVADIRSPRDGKYVENLGLYDPKSVSKEGEFKFDQEKFMHWVNLGAEVSENVMTILAREAPETYKGIVGREVEKKQKALAKRKEQKAKKAKTAS